MNEKTTLLSKVPEVTLLFWLVKIMGTTVGETFADYLSRDLNLGLVTTSAILGGTLVAMLAVQVWSRAYSPWKYWLTVILISVAGTLITDNLTDNLQVPLLVSTLLFGGLLILTFTLWYLSEKTLSIHSIVTRRREAFYWATILLTFALGTAGGDFLAEQVNLGYALSGTIFAVGIAGVALAFWVFKLDPIWSFWVAYILTRPLGASIGDLLIQPADQGGLDLGLLPVNFAFLGAIVAAVAVLTWQRRRREA